MNKESWTRSHDLALVFIAMAYGTDHQLSDEELNILTDSLQGWRDNFAKDEVHEVVMEALAVFLEHSDVSEVTRSIHSLKNELSLEERTRALEEAVRIAEADGVLLSNEQNLISILADSWELKAQEEMLLQNSKAEFENKPSWSLLHDVTLLYVTIAHAADNNLSEDEIAVILEKIGEWQKDYTEEDIRELLRTTLQYYAGGLDKEALQESIEAIRATLPLVQRLVILNDLTHIASVDGEINDHAESMISSLAKAWRVHVRLSDESQA